MSQRRAVPLARWIPIGVAIGVGAGVAMHNIAVGVGCGVAIGAAIGVLQTRKMKKDSDVPT